MNHGTAGAFPVTDEFDESDMEDDPLQLFRVREADGVLAGSEVHGGGKAYGFTNPKIKSYINLIFSILILKSFIRLKLKLLQKML